MRPFALFWSGLLAWLIPATCYAEITIPASCPYYEPIVAVVKIDGMPEGAKLKCRLILPAGCKFSEVSPNVFHVWGKVSPTPYAISARGSWLLTKTVVVPGVTDPIESFVSWGDFDYTTSFTITGEAGPVPPVPPPLPPGEKWLLLVRETGKPSPQLSQLLLSLRADPTLNRKLLIVDKDVPTDSVQALVKQIPSTVSLPALVVASSGDNRFIAAYSLPATLSAIKEYLK